MGISWAVVVLVVYPALQVPMLWVVVRYCGLRDDDGPRDPVGYSTGAVGVDPNDRREPIAGRCPRCGVENDQIARFCENCLNALGPDGQYPRSTR